MVLLWKKNEKKCILCSFIFKIIYLLWTHLQDVILSSGGCFYWLSWEWELLSSLPALRPSAWATVQLTKSFLSKNSVVTVWLRRLTQMVYLLLHVSQLHMVALHCVWVSHFRKGAQRLTCTKFRTVHSTCTQLRVVHSTCSNLVALLSWETWGKVLSWMSYSGGGSSFSDLFV